MNKAPKFTEDDKASYQDFLSSSSHVKAVVLRMRMLLDTFSNKVLSIDTNQPTAERDLLLSKAELQGAQKLLRALEADIAKNKQT